MRAAWPAWLLLALGLTQMAADLAGVGTVKGVAAATMLSPAPKVFSVSRGLETYSTKFFVEWQDSAGEWTEVEVTPERCGQLRGPYNRRNVYGAALAYGPVLASDDLTRPMFDAVVTYALTGDAPLLAELGIDPADVAAVRLRYEPLHPDAMDDALPRLIPIGTEANR